MSMKINRLEIENVKRIKAVKLEPVQNGLTIIGGDNQQGKTSVLDSIAWALGGERYKPSQSTREGSMVPPNLHIVMNNGLVVERKGKNSALKVTDPNGQKAGQQLLNEFVEQLALDLPRFMEASGTEKAKVLLQIIGVGPQLAELEKAGKLKAVITQNIDNLHQMAGSRKVLELHGSVYRNHCMRCGKSFDFVYMKHSTGVPRCECGGMIKPDVVLYEEGLDNDTIEESVRAISQAQVLIIGGTSLAVYPAAGLIDYFRGEALVVINKSSTPRDRNADLLIKEPIGQVFSQIKVNK